MADDEYVLEEGLHIVDEDEDGEEEVESVKLDTTADKVSTDALQLLLRDVERFPVFTPEQEREVTTKAAAGDPEAKEALVNHNLRMVIMVASKYHKHNKTPGISYIDLIQEGVIGLMRATDKFDPDRGYKFSTYAMWWIRQAIGRAIAEKSRTIRVPTHMIDRLNKVRKAEEAILGEKGREPTYSEIAERVEMSEEKVREIIRHTRIPLSLDRPITDNEEESSVIEDLHTDVTETTPHEKVVESVQADKLTAAIKDLPYREKKILELFYGVGDVDEPWSVKDISHVFCITPTRTRQIMAGSLEKLRKVPDLQILRGDYE